MSFVKNIFKSLINIIKTPFIASLAVNEVRRIIKNTETKKDDEWIMQAQNIIEILHSHIPNTRKEKALIQVSKSEKNKFKIGADKHGLNFSLEL